MLDQPKFLIGCKFTPLLLSRPFKKRSIMNRWVGLFLFVLTSLFGDVEDHLQPVLNKTDASKMRNIDFIYLINLDERPEKYQTTIEALAPYSIFPCRFSAINGWKLSLADILDVGVMYDLSMSNGTLGTYFTLDGAITPQYEPVGEVGRVYFTNRMPLGSVGCSLSHLSVLQDAYDSGYETIWIMEDDIEIIQNPHLISDRIDELDQLVGKKGWDVLFTDKDTKNTEGQYVYAETFAWRPNYTPATPWRFSQKTNISDNLRKIGARYGSYSMILRRSGIRKILTFLKSYHLFLAYDMEYTLPATIKLFTVLDDIVSTQPRALSDNGKPTYDLTQGTN